MTRFAAVATFFFSFHAFAQLGQTTRLYVDVADLRLRVDPGTLMDVPVSVHNAPDGASPVNVRAQIEVTNGVVEKMDVPAGWSCTTSAQHVDCSMPTLDVVCRCSETAHLSVRVPAEGGGETKLVASATSELPPEYPTLETKTAQSYRWFPVTTTADAGPGSFRSAIESVNESCGDAPCKIVFEIATAVPSEGWFTIIPSTPLPAITAKRVVVDGDRQTAFSGDTNPRGPEIAIDGHLAGEGLVMLSPCEAVVDGLVLGNFMTNQGLWFAPSNDPRLCHFEALDRREVARNFIGVDPTGTAAWPNRRGLRLDGAVGLIRDNVISHNSYSGVWCWFSGPTGIVIVGNRIESNGASGLFLSALNTDVVNNVIAHNAQMGVAAAGQTGDIGHNSMRDNGGLGIDRGLDGVDPLDETDVRVNPPTLLSATYDPSTNRTSVVFTIHAHVGPAQANSYEMYANDGPDGEGETPLGTVYVFPNPAHFEIAGDHRGKWINATAMRYNQVFAKPPSKTIATNAVIGENKMTSELSASVLVK